MTRTRQDISGERRSLVEEQRRTRDAAARAALQLQIHELDRQFNDTVEGSPSEERAELIRGASQDPRAMPGYQELP